MSHIGPNVHQVRNAIAALALGIALKEFAHLEEQHHKHRLGELRLGTRQETDAQGAPMVAIAMRKCSLKASP